MRQWFRQRVLTPIIDLLKQGITPEKIALSIAFGAVLGVLPALGITTVLCLVLAIVFRLNLVAIQVVNYAMYPLQLLLLVPFIRMGEAIFRARKFDITLAQIELLYRGSWMAALRVLWTSLWHAMTAWALVAPFACLAIYFVMKPVLHRAAVRVRG